MSETDEGAVKLLKACDDMLDLHRRQGTDDGAAARQVAAKRRELEQRIRLERSDGDTTERAIEDLEQAEGSQHHPFLERL